MQLKAEPKAGDAARLYERLPKGLVKCTACARHCQVGEGGYGFCGVRKNENGKLKLMVYGKPTGLAIDPVEKKPLFHFLPGTGILSFGTFGCAFACEFCQNWEMSQFPKIAGGAGKTIAQRRELLEKTLEGMEYFAPEEIARIAKEKNCSSVAFTYNEPAVFSEYAYDCAVEAKKLGLKAVFVSDGYESEESIEYLAPALDAINIDIKGFTDRFYEKLCHAKLEPVLESVKRAHRLGIWTEITTLVIPKENDSKEELAQIAGFVASVDKNIPWHVSAFHPEYKMLGHQATKPEKLVEARKIGFDAGLKFAYAGNLPAQYSNMESTSCPECKEILIERTGFCVARNKIGRAGKCPKCNEKIAGIWN